MDISVDVTTLPAERALLNANSGVDDGDALRIGGMQQAYPNLIQVPEKILDADFVAYAARPGIALPGGWPALKPYVVAYAVGYKIFDANVKEAVEITRTRSIDELFPLLALGRADVVLVDRWQGNWIARHDGYRPTLIEPPLAQVSMYIYLNRKHAALVPELARAMAAMKSDGTYRKLFEQHLVPYDLP
ncbi:MAG: transporter substrate-binding domain-containing protein [Caldimonas sp.]